MASTSEIARLVPHPREVFLRQNEARILSAAAALLAADRDPAIAAAQEAVLFADDLYDIHDVTAKFYVTKEIPHRVENHQRYAAKAMQLKLRALDQLAHLVL